MNKIKCPWCDSWPCCCADIDDGTDLDDLQDWRDQAADDAGVPKSGEI